MKWQKYTNGKNNHKIYNDLLNIKNIILFRNLWNSKMDDDDLFNLKWKSIFLLNVFYTHYIC